MNKIKIKTKRNEGEHIECGKCMALAPIEHSAKNLRWEIYVRVSKINLFSCSANELRQKIDLKLYGICVD